MTSLQLVALLGYLGLLIGVSRHINFKQLVENKRQQHLVFGAAASVFFLWLFRAGIFDGLDVHFLWLSALTLTLGFRWAMLAAVLPLLGETIAGKESWEMLGVNGLLGVAAPIAITYSIYSFTFHKLPKHLFVYVFLCAFLPGAAMIAMKMALLSGYYYVEGTYPWNVIFDNYLVLTPLMLFPEGLLNGMTMTLLIIYKPEWVYTFHDKFYIDKK